MAGAPDPAYDIQGAVETLIPGVVMQRSLLDAAGQQYAAKGYAPLAAADVPTILANANNLDLASAPARYMPTTPPVYPAAPPPYPTKLPRIADSNPDPFDKWVEFGPSLTAPSP